MFEKFPLVPHLYFYRKCGFCVTMPKLPYLGYSGSFGAAFCAKMFSSLCTLTAYKLQDNAICSRGLFGLSNEGYFLGDFLKISPGPPFKLFPKMRLFGYLEKIAITWQFRHFLSHVLRQNLAQSLHFERIPIRG